MDADGLWKAVDGFEAQQERTRPPLPTSPWETGNRTPVSHKRPQAAPQNQSLKEVSDRLSGR